MKQVKTCVLTCDPLQCVCTTTVPLWEILKVENLTEICKLQLEINKAVHFLILSFSLGDIQEYFLTLDYVPKLRFTWKYT